MSSLNKINTKLEAYRLVHDPTRLLSLLYSKYGDIEEDENYLYLNQLLYNRSSHYNIIFKEVQYNDFINEYLKRYYLYKESSHRIPKLNDYYKNYHQFFCRPMFRNFKISKIMHNYGDMKAEIFYRNNYATLNDEEEEKEKSYSETSLSSLDNITDNKTIFNKNNRYIIDNNVNLSKCTLTLDTSRSLKTNLNLLTKRSKDDSFIKSLSPLINFNGVFGPKKKEKKKQNKTTSNTNRNNKNNNNNNNKNNNKLNNKNNKNNIKNTLYSLVKNNLNYRIVNNKKNIIKSPKLKSYLSNYKQNIEETNKNKQVKNKEKINNNIEEKTKNNKKENKMNSNFRNFSKLSASLNNNLNNINFSNTNTNVRNSLNNGSNSKSKQNKIPNGNYHSSVHSSGSTIQKSKNKTFDIKHLGNVNSLNKFNSNSNFSNFNNNQNSMRNKKKKNYGSNFNLVKSPLSSLNGIPPSKQKNSKFSKNKTTYNTNNSKNSILSNPSNSLRKNSFNKKENKNSKDKKNNFQKRKNISSSNSINKNNLIFSSQRSTSNTSNTNILSPKNGINNNRMIINLNNIYNISRNKKNMITHTQTNVKTFRKEITSHKSVDEEKNKLKNILSNINKKDPNYQMSQRLSSQIEELIKKSKIIYVKNNNGINNNNDNLKNQGFYNGNDKGSKKSIIENSVSSMNGSNKSIRGNTSKPINVNLNLNMRINSEERKDKIIRVISPKK